VAQPELQLALDWRDNSHPNEIWAARYHAGFAAATDFRGELRAGHQEEDQGGGRASGGD